MKDLHEDVFKNTKSFITNKKILFYVFKDRQKNPLKNKSKQFYSRAVVAVGTV